MKRLLVLVVFLLLLGCFIAYMIITGSHKGGGIKGKVLDGKGRPLSGVTVTAKQVKQQKWGEQMEVTSGADGAFEFENLYPKVEYAFSASTGEWASDSVCAKEESAQKGRTTEMKHPVIVRFMLLKNGMMKDSRTGLMWAPKDNGQDINWDKSKAFCESYQGAGYTDWRMPTMGELAEICIKKKLNRKGYFIAPFIELTSCCPWTVNWVMGAPGKFDFQTCSQGAFSPPGSPNFKNGRALPVREAK